eukprot:166820_1
MKWLKVEEHESSQQQQQTQHSLDTTSKCINFLNYTFFYWVFALVGLSNINKSSVPPLPNRLKSQHVYTAWNNAATQELNENKKVKTMGMIWNIHKSSILNIIFLKIIAMCTIILVFYVFIYVYQVLLAINVNDNNNLNELIILSAIIFIILCFKSSLTSFCVHQVCYIQGQVLSSILIMLYNKTIHINIDQPEKQQIINLIGSDIETINVGIYFLLNYTCPIVTVIIISIIGLCLQMGASAIFGILFFIFIGFPFQLFVGFKLAKCTKSKLNIADKRINLISQILRAIRIVKTSCFELPIMDKINAYRQEESNNISQRDFYFALLVLSNFLIPVMMLVFSL